MGYTVEVIFMDLNDIKYCRKCGNPMSFNERLGGYYCDKCYRLWDTSEVDDVKVDFEPLALLMWIPLVNLFLLLGKRNTVKKAIFINGVIAAMFFHIAIAFAALKWYDYTEAKLTAEISKSVYNSVNKNIPIVNAKMLEVPILQKIDPGEKPDETEMFTFDVLADYLNKNVLTGDSVLKVIEQFPEEVYLIQTSAVRQKENNGQYYLNVGKIIGEAQPGANEGYWFLDSGIPANATITDKVYEDYSRLSEDNTTYRIYKASYYVTTIVYSNGNVVGLVFTEELTQ